MLTPILRKDNVDAPALPFARYIVQLCRHLTDSGNSPNLELVEFDLRDGEPKDYKQASRTIRTVCQGGGNAEHTYYVNVLFDETELLQDEDYSSPADLIRMLQSEHIPALYNFHVAQ